MVKIFITLILSLLVISCGDETLSSNQPTQGSLTSADSIVSLYKNISTGLVKYSELPNSAIRFDSLEERSPDPPYFMTKGVLYLYIKDVLFDSIKYYSYHGGMFRPPVYACITNGTYILSIKSRVDNMYNQGEANWYLMKNDGSDAFKIPKVLSLNGAGLYEANYVNICNVKPGPTMLIFYGFYYCDRETYVTYNIPDGFKNYHRRRETGCESPWKWITQ